MAAQWANDLVKQLNEQLREQAIADSKKRVGYLEQELAKTTLQDMRAVLYNLLESEKQKAMLANVNEDFALEVIDPAVAPETREKPKRKLIVALGGVCGGFLGIFAVFLCSVPAKLKSTNSEEAHPFMSKQFSKISSHWAWLCRPSPVLAVRPIRGFGSWVRSRSTKSRFDQCR